MAWYLESTGPGVQISNRGFIDVLILAQRFGWDGRGMVSRESPDSEACCSDVSCEPSAGQVDAEEDNPQSESLIPAESAAAFADALETAFAILKLRNPLEIEAIAARERVRAATFAADSTHDDVSTEDLIDMFGHQKQLLESIIAVARGGEVSIW